ncbi:hypothetical protein PLICRDRAFT_127097 [Plicaturopsis crispa FD-325 SS-3]|uniref:BTB domain-containing protein n=1 Tax=Plicaturopsis crispa FD-325 SS-3 TaxID=944288 RepID=A0A0C9SXA8_PLICR|nr:hypothetical protein PLICRDRAFT_127097 [Plicaturopsis crispa FD-325 SS-3]
MAHRSVQYYYDDGTDIFLVGGVLYKLHRTVLQATGSPLFCDMFMIPQPKDSKDKVEGTSDEKPIVVPQATAEEFHNLLELYLYPKWTPPPHPVSRYIDVLKLSTQWGMSNVREAAIWNISQYNNRELAATTKLELARRYNIPQWGGPAFRQLVNRPLKSLSNDDLDCIGVAAFVVLAKANEAIAEERRLVATKTPPNVCCAQCTHHVECSRAWKDVWWNKIAPSILHPDPGWAIAFPGEIKQKVSGLQVQGMGQGCRDETIAAVLDGCGFDGVGIITDMAVARVEKLLFS